MSLGIKKKIKFLAYQILGKDIVHFIHVGKTGGSAIKDALGHYRTTPHTHIVFHNHQFKLEDVPKNHQFFFFLRDPLTRFVSGFYSRKREGKPRYHYPWTNDEKSCFETFETPNDLAEALSSKDKKIKEIALHSMKTVGHIKEPYEYWFKDFNYLLTRKNDLVMVGFQEQLSEDFSKLKELLELPKECTLSKDTTKTHKTPDKFNKELSLTARKNLKKWYEKDFEFVKNCKKMQFGEKND